VLITTQGEKGLKANFVHFCNRFRSPGAEGEMVLQCTFKYLCYSGSVEAWIKFFHMSCQNKNTRFCVSFPGHINIRKQLDAGLLRKLFFLS